MKISFNRLKQYVDIPVSTAELCEKMIMAGFEIESVEDLSKSLQNVVVGRILSIKPHKNSDHLLVCEVDAGKQEPLQVITGAQNVFEGAYVPVALDGAVLPGGKNIKRGNFRGLESNGMLCSGGELALTDHDWKGASVNGIMLMDDRYPAGTDLCDIFGLNDIVIDFKITANRPDCNCVAGVAREAAVVLNGEFREPVPRYNEAGGNVRDYISVEVKDFDLCPRYCGAVVRDVVIKESPDWMKSAIRAAGMRPINNIVDITNFVMLETGQPMHAFDYRDIAGRKIIVRRAENGESITTLDGERHPLSEDMLVIADGVAPSCIAGIMGGENSEIKDDTATIFLEAAKFRRDSVRRTARKLGMRTESSARFERGVDIINTGYAMRRALQLIEETGSGKIVSGLIDENSGLPEPRDLSVSVNSVNALLGITVPADEMSDILNRLGIETRLDDGTLKCKVPSRRDDIEGGADIAEEVLRVYGCSHIQGTPMRGVVLRGKKLPEREKSDRVKEALTAAGAYEVCTYSFISQKAAEILRLRDDDVRRKAIRIQNPLGDEYSVLRTQLVTSMLNVLATNINRKNPAARFFELSKVFESDELPPKKHPREIPVLAIGAYGDGEDFFTVKGMVESVLNIFSNRNICERSTETYYHPGRCGEYRLNGRRAAVFGEIHPDVACAFDIACRVYVAEVALDVLYAVNMREIVYHPLPRFPAVERDFALQCAEDLPVGVMENAIREGSGNLLEGVKLFDIYRGEQIPEGQKSVAFTVTLRSEGGTLSEDEINYASESIIKKLESVGATLRQ